MNQYGVRRLTHSFFMLSNEQMDNYPQLEQVPLLRAGAQFFA